MVQISDAPVEGDEQRYGGPYNERAVREVLQRLVWVRVRDLELLLWTALAQRRRLVRHVQPARTEANLATIRAAFKRSMTARWRTGCSSISSALWYLTARTWRRAPCRWEMPRSRRAPPGIQTCGSPAGTSAVLHSWWPLTQCRSRTPPVGVCHVRMGARCVGHGGSNAPPPDFVRLM